MTYSSDFWTLVGTAAPVIALSSVLLLNDQLNLLGKILDAKPNEDNEAWSYLLHRITLLYSVNCFSLVMQAITFWNAVLSVALGKNEEPLRLIAWMQILGFFALIVSFGLMPGTKVRLTTFNRENDHRARMKANRQSFRRAARRSAEQRQRTYRP